MAEEPLPCCSKLGQKKGEDGGVIFVDEKTVSLASIGDLVRGFGPSTRRIGEMGLDR
jgi:hypothetical protein